MPASSVTRVDSGWILRYQGRGPDIMAALQTWVDEECHERHLIRRFDAFSGPYGESMLHVYGNSRACLRVVNHGSFPVAWCKRAHA